MKMFIMYIMLFMSIFMFFMNHPIPMGLLILSQTLLLCLISGMMIYSYWFSYILFLIFLGGLMVLFIYVSTIASNETFKLNKINYIYIMMINLLLIIIMIFSMKMNWVNISNMEMMNLNYKFIIFNSENKINLSKLYNKQTFMMMMTVILYLLIALIAMVKIINVFHGPLRSF
uniref:NADH dehydrogenase subunit 6 n=1 Tax=Morophaga formosana TaxID=1983356 RepID=UPI0022FD456D|nr:NADH dehydrogenase subunit 6 [Morophaga formosana]WAU48142.1 NADH dehydrogenase subunit 6 [Morophaga formosana]